MRPYLILILVCLLGGELYGQSFYVTDGNSRLQKITIDNGQLSSPQPVLGCVDPAQSIAFHNDVMYYTDVTQLKLGHILNNTSSNCEYLPLNSSQSFIGLTIDKKGILYLTASNGLLFTYDLATKGPLVLKGTLPAQPSADMIFYKDQLYVSTKVGIYQVDIASPAQSKLVIPGSDILGLTVVSINSTTNKAYALQVNNSITTVLDLDLDNYTIGQAIGTLPFYVFDAASNVEDGSYLGLNFKDIEITADCPFTGRGTVKVITMQTSSAYRYKLNNIENATGIFSNVSPGQYTITITDGYETKQKTIDVAPFVLAKPTLTVISRSPKCLDKGNIAITADADADKYAIVFEGNSYPLNRNFDLGAGSYHFDIQNLNGCIVDSRNITLTQQSCPILVDSTIVKQDCADPKKGAVTVYTSPGNDKYHFAINDGTAQSTGVFNGLSPNTYTIKITSDGGGTKTVQAIIQDISANDPQVSYQKTDVTCRTNGSIKFNIPVANKTGYMITFRSASYPIDHTFMFVDSGTYDFKITKPGGCLLKEEKITITKEECEVVFFPNTFTPNNDGVNDTFRPKEGTVVKQLQLKIFNRLGSVIYTSDKAGNGWDGQYLGKPVPAGVYYWVATYINNEGLNTAQNGSITLLR